MASFPNALAAAQNGMEIARPSWLKGDWHVALYRNSRARINIPTLLRVREDGKTAAWGNVTWADMQATDYTQADGGAIPDQDIERGSMPWAIQQWLAGQRLAGGTLNEGLTVAPAAWRDPDGEAVTLLTLFIPAGKKVNRVPFSLSPQEHFSSGWRLVG